MNKLKLFSNVPHAGVSNLKPVGHIQLRMAMSVAQHKIIHLLKTIWDFFFFQLHVAMYLMCGPRQLVFFQCGPEMPKGGTPLIILKNCFLLFDLQLFQQTQKFHTFLWYYLKFQTISQFINSTQIYNTYNLVCFKFFKINSNGRNDIQ